MATTTAAQCAIAATFKGVFTDAKIHNQMTDTRDGVIGQSRETCPR